MTVRGWDPAADDHRVGRFGPGPGVRRAAVATLFGSRPRSAASRRHVARPARRARRPGGAKALLRDVELAVLDVELAVLVDRLPEEGLELRSGYPTPGHWGVSELLTEFLDPVRRARTSRLGHRGLLPGFEGIPGRSPALGDPSGLYNPGVLGVAPKLGTGEGTQDPGAGGGRVGLGRAAPFPELLRAGDPQLGTHPNIFDPVERIPVAWISPPLELSPNSTRWS